MKKLVLLVSVFLLVAGMVAADVTFAPTVEGTTSVTWTLDLNAASEYEPAKNMNSGFSATNSVTFDMGVTVDPFDAKGGEGIYGEVTVDGLTVDSDIVTKDGAKADSEADSDFILGVPSIEAKLWFSEALYASIFAGADPNYDYVTPLGNLITVDDNKQEGTWYNKDDDHKGTVIAPDQGNAGYGFTYMAGDLTVNGNFYSLSEAGKSNISTKGLNKFKIDDYDLGAGDGEKNNGIMTQAEFENLLSAIYGLGTTLVNWNAGLSLPVSYNGGAYTKDYTLPAVVLEGYAAGGVDMYQVNLDGSWVQLWEQRSDKMDAGQLVSEIYAGKKTNDSLYGFSLDVTYTLTDVGTFKAYVMPMHDNHANIFQDIAFGASADIALASFDMVGLQVAADMMIDNRSGVEASEKFEYELSVTVPVTVGELLSAKVQAAWTDAKDTAKDNTPLDLYTEATLTAAGATVIGKYQVSNFAEYGQMSQSYTLDASYPVAVGEGTVTPKIGWAQDMDKPWTASEGQEGYLTVQAVAEIVDNTTFTAKYVSGDLMTSASNVDAGVFTFTTEFAY